MNNNDDPFADLLNFTSIDSTKSEVKKETPNSILKDVKK